MHEGAAGEAPWPAGLGWEFSVCFANSWFGLCLRPPEGGTPAKGGILPLAWLGG
jgi:hypothetical protein